LNKTIKKETNKILIEGTVQGVGFRPFVYRLATELGLRGRVKNTLSGVEIIISGEASARKAFLEKIRYETPPSAIINKIEVLPSENKKFTEFSIDKSKIKSNAKQSLPPDISVCAECEKELKDEKNKRFHYPFTSCVNCGPRFSIINSFPYDRKNIAISAFTMCEKCHQEYVSISNRRYHSQANCCPGCGPQYFFEGETGEAAIEQACAFIKKAGIVGIKGVGGYHIVGNAEDIAVLKEIRRLKEREHKPLALMAKDKYVILEYCNLSKKNMELLESCRRPIVLLKKKNNNKITEIVAPENAFIGFMLPYAPIHHIIFNITRLNMLVFTSLNRQASPTIKDNEEAFEFFKGKILGHNLEISFRSDDSVLKSSKSENVFLRRSRGYVPEAVPIITKKEVLTSGASENISFCYTREGQAYPSQYFGNIEDYRTEEIYRDSINKWKKIWSFKPIALGCDLHPGYRSTAIFQQISEEWHLPLKRIQHHHAHLAGCASENQLKRECIGAAFDGTGYGADGEVWGGEFMRFDYNKFLKIGGLKPHKMPGAAAATKEPWRMAMSYIEETGKNWQKYLKADSVKTAVYKTLKSSINSPFTSSAGRLFDAVAALIAGIEINTYSARAPIALESIVNENYLNESYEIIVNEKGDCFDIDTTDLFNRVLEDIDKNMDKGRVAAKFHAAIADAVVLGLSITGERTGLTEACISGGVFCNYYLSDLIAQKAENTKITIFKHKKISPNDNGISYGQAAVCSWEGEF